ncbi:MAG: hypothetical protein IT436_00870 [Phycisphaerales bacterium]|nr:hypothetical protein [Phycisphaerales bacterium]
MNMMSRVWAGAAVALSISAVCTVRAADWTNSGGNAGRNGLTSELGPDAADLLWTYTTRSSIISWLPVIEDGRVFVVRQTGFPPEPAAGTSSPVVAINLDTGAQEWIANIPFVTGDWTTWVAGVKNGRVFACRGGNGASSSAPAYALDAADGHQIWQSVDEVDAGAYDGVVFADNGDLIIASFRTIKRIRWADGLTAWTATRVGSVSGNCGGAVHGNTVYVADAVVGGHSIKAFDLTTGAFKYSSPVMPGFTLQNSPMVGPDGTVYLSRTQNNPPVDNFYAFTDTGTGLVEKWHIPAGWSTSSEFGVGPDGSVYMLAPGNIIQRLDPDDGAVMSSSSSIAADFMTPRFAIDRDGRVFFSNGAFSDGRVFSFNADLTERWSVSVPNINIGGPAMGRDGTLVLVGTSNIRAYRTERVDCIVDLNGDGIVDFADYLEFLNLYDAQDPRVDFNQDGIVDFADYLEFLNLYDAGC